MKRSVKRFHVKSKKTKKNGCLQIQERRFSDGDYYEYISLVIANTRKTCNDFCSFKSDAMNVLATKTGNDLDILLQLFDKLQQHIRSHVDMYGEYICAYEPTDNKRESTYKKYIEYMCNKHNFNYNIIESDDTFYVIINQ